MKSTQGRTRSKKANKSLKKHSNGIKKVAKRAKKSVSKIKAKKNNLLGNAKNNLTKLKKKSSKALTKVKNKVHATEKDIVRYVKENPIKSYSTVALTALITGYLAYRKIR